MPHRFLREKSDRSRGKGDIVLTHFKILIPSRFPTKFVLTLTLRGIELIRSKKCLNVPIPNLKYP